VGNNPLDPAFVIYTDMNDNPSPQPTGMISDLIALREPARLWWSITVRLISTAG
jgi:hypothetical protein